MAITFPTVNGDDGNPLIAGSTFQPPGQPIVYEFQSVGIWNIRSAVLMRKIDLFMGTPSIIQQGFANLLPTQIQSFITDGAETVFFKDVKLDTDNTTIVNTGGNLGMFSDRGIPTETGAVNFNLIG